MFDPISLSVIAEGEDLVALSAEGEDLLTLYF
jgi:hypothetical protein